MIEAIIYIFCVIAFILTFAFVIKWISGDFDK